MTGLKLMQFWLKNSTGNLRISMKSADTKSESTESAGNPLL